MPRYGQRPDQHQPQNAIGHLARQCREARLALELSQEAVAHAAGIAVSTYVRFERLAKTPGTRSPSYTTVVRITTVLNVALS